MTDKNSITTSSTKMNIDNIQILYNFPCDKFENNFGILKLHLGKGIPKWNKLSFNIYA